MPVIRSKSALGVLAVFFVALGVAVTSAQDTKSLTGVWKITLKGPAEKKAVEKTLFVIQDGNVLLVKDSPKGEVLRGSVEGDSVHLPVRVSTKGEKKTLKLAGKIKEGNLMAGTASDDGRIIEWKGLGLASIWACDNHDPVHTATSEKQIRDLTNKHHCEGWHEVGAAFAVKGRFERSIDEK